MTRKYQKRKLKEINWFQNSKWECFEKYDREFNRVWKEMHSKCGSQFINYIYEFLQKNQFLLTEGESFNIELVVDTNVIFAEILAIMRGKPSYIRTIIANPFLVLYAPPEIRAEVEKAIIEDLPKKYDKDDARKIAQDMLSHVNILKGERSKAWLRAHAIIGQRDKTDIPFIALAFSIGTHGIISRDQDFSTQDEIKIWELGEAGRLVSKMTKGSFTFFILNLSIAAVWEMSRSLCVIFLKVVTAVLRGLVLILAALFQGGVDILTRIPLWIFMAGIGAIALTLLLWKEAREKSGDMLNVLWDWMRDAAKKIAKIFADIIKRVKAFIEITLPVVSYFIKGVGYLFYSTHQLMVNIRDLEKLRVKST